MFTGVYIIFLISAQNIDCGYSLELPRLMRHYEMVYYDCEGSGKIQTKDVWEYRSKQKIHGTLYMILVIETLKDSALTL